MLTFQSTLCIFLFCIASNIGFLLRKRCQNSDGGYTPDTQDFDDCVCVPFYLCDENNTVITSGEGIIDIRTGAQRTKCRDYHVCCKKPKETTDVPATSETQSGQCGIRNYRGVNNINPRIMRNSMTTDVSTSFGEFPWMAAVMKTDSKTYEDILICGGSVIHKSVVLTAAHCLEGMNITDIKVRAGEWDTQSISESLPHQDRYVSKAAIHPQYRKEYLYSNIALLFLTSELLFMDNVGTICLPEEGIYFNSSDCIATGWGKNTDDHTGQYQTSLKKIEMPLVINSECQEALRTTKLGRHYILDQSFLCAGGIENEDTCRGDGGGPLACKIVGDTVSYTQVGVTSWGVGCGTSIPGVYASVSRTVPWIKTQLESIEV